MENKTTFFDRLRNVVAPSELVKVRGAYYMAKFGHRSQVRKEQDVNGQPLRYFEHPRRVAIILMDELRVFDVDMICAALLHDALEDTDAITVDVIEQFFGVTVARYVTCLTKIKGEGDAYIKRLMNAPDNALIIKVCDRIDNLRSLGSTTDEFKIKQVKETIQKYHPLLLSRSKVDIRLQQPQKLLQDTCMKVMNDSPNVKEAVFEGVIPLSPIAKELLATGHASVEELIQTYNRLNGFSHSID